MRELRLYNTMGRQVELLRPLRPGEVRLYACGPTVYNHPHIGNLRTFLFVDLVGRSLRFLGYRVTMVMNVTDVDDKTILRSQELGLSLDEFTRTYVDSFFAALDTLRVERADHYPRATEHMAEMIALVERLVERGYAYRGDDGSVYFRLAADADYGRLARIDPTQVRRGERVASDDYDKEDVRDFVLWKAAKEGEPHWDSPWGPGRPGWHLECSAMGMKYLGESFDLHCGGVDLIFPHHENEIAQSESATGKEFVHTWVHAEHLLVDGQKMSKSLGNEYTLQDLLDRGVEPRALRWLFLSSHYRQRLNFTFEALEAAAGALRRLDEMRFRLENAREQGEPSPAVAAAVDELVEGFAAALGNDLNSSAALSVLFQFVKEVNKRIEQGELGTGDRDRIFAALARVDEVLGVLDPAPWKAGEAAEGLCEDRIAALVAERQEARRRRDFATADRIRDQLREAGITIEDTPQGARWRRE